MRAMTQSSEIAASLGPPFESVGIFSSLQQL